MTDLPVRYKPDEIKLMAEAVVKSKLFPQITTVEAAMTLMLICDAEGIHPMMALRRYFVSYAARPRKRPAVAMRSARCSI